MFCVVEFLEIGDAATSVDQEERVKLVRQTPSHHILSQSVRNHRMLSNSDAGAYLGVRRYRNIAYILS